MKPYADSNNNNNGRSSSWSKRFIITAMMHALIVVSLTIFLVLSQVSFLKPAVSRVIAAGGAGTWFTVGYTMYIMVGVVTMSVYGLFYYYVETIAKKNYRHIVPRIMAWGNFVLINSGTIAAMSMLMYGGYNAGAAMLPAEVGGKGFSATQAHTILGPLAEPISIAILATAIGALLGIIGSVASHLAAKRNVIAMAQKEQGKNGHNTSS